MSRSRITQAGIATVALRGLQSNLTRMQTLQNQLSSGKAISRPSDDPSGTVSAMTLRSRRAGDEQYLRNIDQGIGRLTVTDNALTQLSDRLRSIRELVIQSRDGAIGTSSQAAIAAQITAVGSEVTDLYNTTYLDRPIFGGTTAGKTAVDATGAYVGDDGAVPVRISSDAVVRTDITGTAAGANTVPGMIAQVAADVVSATGASDADLDNLDAALSRVAQALGDVGARSERINQTRTMVDSHRLDLTSRISMNEDVDMPEAIMNLSSAQVAYQAALQSAAKIQQTSLVDFLK
ncbi:MAG TPA: flagellar hook-associated protein FlgL [Kineosporiaceae bacterium]|nr:flagellar hook-associated protein FlgL [Kineosporiaceae bacterium]